MNLIFCVFFIFSFKLCINEVDSVDSTTVVTACNNNNDCQNESYCAGVSGCLNTSNCTDNYCDCAIGHFGWHCEYATCDDWEKCLNGANCYIIDNKHICSCTDDFTGENCETYVCNNLTNCNGICLSKDKCQCNSNINSTNTSEPSGKECLANCTKYNPCKNGATCSITDQKYSCTCSVAWAGTRCEKRKCTDDWCPGICSEDECICPPGFNGESCQIANCSEFLGCEGVGTCIANGGDIRCSCNTKQYGGKYCEYNCTEPCEEGVCGSDELCYCNENYFGEKCNISISEALLSNQMALLNYLFIAIVVIVLVVLYITKYQKKVNALNVRKFNFDTVMDDYSQVFIQN